MNRKQESLRRAEVANAVLATFSDARLDRTSKGWLVSWPNRDDGRTFKRWSVSKGQSFYPPWASRFPGGGTSMTALSQLVRWCQHRPVFPLMTWEYWASETVKLLPLTAVFLLSECGYPDPVPCVLCGTTLVPATGLDWWDLNGLSGPCCSHMSIHGCRQKAMDVADRERKRAAKALQ